MILRVRIDLFLYCFCSSVFICVHSRPFSCVLAEIFRSLQGEGLLTGMPSVFVRTSGCNLRADFAIRPTRLWEPEGDDFSVDEILQRVDELLGADKSCRHAVFNRSSALPQLVPLAAALRSRGLHITVETAGTLYLPLACDLMSIESEARATPRRRTRDLTLESPTRAARGMCRK